MRAGREESGLSQVAASVASQSIAKSLDLPVEVTLAHVKWTESSPPRPLANPLCLTAILSAYGRNWYQVLEVLSIPSLIERGDGAAVQAERGDFDGICANQCRDSVVAHWKVGGEDLYLCDPCDNEARRRILTVRRR